MIEIEREVWSTQGKGAVLTLHVGETAIYFGRMKRWTGPRIELFTHFQRFRVSRPYRHA